MVLRPWARSSRWRAGVPEVPADFEPAELCDPEPMLPQTAREAARRFGDATAYITENDRPISYAEVDHLSDEVAAGLARRGVRAGDVVALILPPGPEYLLSYLGAAKLGAVTTGVNDRLSAKERAVVLERAAPRLVVATDAVAPSGTDASFETVVIPLHADKEPDAPILAELRADAAVPALADDDDRPVAIIFTSGTTGAPKGALYTNRQLAFITRTDVGDTWGGGTRSFTGTSFAHLGFMTKLAGNLQRGGTSFIMARWRAEAALQLVARERMTTVAGVPTQLALMLARPDFDEFDLESVRFLVVGGGPVTPGLADEARARFGAALATRYSCTEAGIGLGTAFDDPDEDAVLSVGRPHAAVDLAVLDEDDQPVPVGEVGRVCLRSPAVMRGYWRDPDATREAFTADGHVRTGDLGWVDDRGRLRLVGRSKEMYVRGGYNVYPVEVEAVLSGHPAIAAVAVVPRVDSVMGELGVAAVVPRDPGHPPTLEDLRAYGRDRLAAYKLPEALAIVTALPLTAMEKIDRAALAREIGEPAP
jgi:acyl-CoA synthetase (AMP-forming)/AMP-acid ligase II